MRIGFHFPFAGGLKSLQNRVKSSRGNTYQIFARGLRGGQLHDLKEKDLNNLLEYQEWKNIKPTIIHSPYTYNLANLELYDEVKVLEDLNYAIKFRSPYYVVHPGRHRDMHPLQASENLKYQLWDILNHTDWMGEILVKNLSGAGSEIGYDLRDWKEMITYHPQVKGALDFSRLYAAGYDFIGEDNSERLYYNIGEYIGWEHIKVLYINDTHRTLGSRKKDDRPPPLGEGSIGFNGYRHILKKEEIKKKIWIVENSRDSVNYLRSLNYLTGFF